MLTKLNKVRPKTRYDFVGHITYPCQDSVKNVLFVQNPTSPYDVVRRGKEKIIKKHLDSDLRRFLEDIGYTVERVNEVNDKLHQSVKRISIGCENKSCLYFDETYHGRCSIKLKAEIEVVDKNNTKILVTFKARDMRETTIKSDCIVKYIKDRTGVEGSPDTYGKMEMC